VDDAIENFMTQAVHTIAANRTLGEAHEVMRRYKIRHLPVMSKGKLVGMVTQRDLSLVETLKGVDPAEVEVEDAVSEDVYTVTADTPLAEVARRMARDKLGSAVVMRGNKVVGIFTGVDALSALDFLLTSPPVKVALHEALIPARKAVRS
jgi:acetoin utilization protein AcuB